MDSQGGRWKPETNVFQGMASELGLHSLLGLKVNGETAAFDIPRRIGGPKGESRWGDSVYEASGLDGKLKVERRAIYSTELAIFATQDIVTNASDTPLRATVEVILAGGSRIARLAKSDGMDLDMKTPLLPLVGDQGKMAVIFDGEKQPCVLLAVEAANDRMPSVQLKAEGVLGVQYDLELKPQESRVLRHVVAPRSMEAFGDLETTWTSWEPLKIWEKFVPLTAVPDSP